MSEKRPTLDQQRAQHAWRSVDDARSLKEDSKNFAREAKRLPVRIRTAGLGQSLAFLAAKSKDGDHRFRLLSSLGDWLLKERRLATRPAGSNDGNALIQAIIADDADADLLRQATDEALRYLQWLTRFSEAEFKPDEDEPKNERS